MLSISFYGSFILLSVVDRPRHGYAILQEAEARTEIELAARLDPAYQKPRANLLLLDWR